MKNPKSIYIVLEGLDGTGKSTLFKNLKQFYLKSEISFDTICPTQIVNPNSLIERLYRKKIHFKKINFIRTFIFAYRSYLSSKKTNWNSRLILGDRSILVSYVKHWRKYFNSPFLTIIIINLLEPFIQSPDYIIYLNAPESVIFERLQKKEVLEIDETPESLIAMKRAYNEIRTSNPIKRLKSTVWIDVNADMNSSELFNEALEIINSILNRN